MTTPNDPVARALLDALPPDGTPAGNARVRYSVAARLGRGAHRSGVRTRPGCTGGSCAEPGPARLSRALTGAFALPLGFYERMLGSGNSLAATLLFCWGRGYDLFGALGHYYVLVFFWCALAA